MSRLWKGGGNYFVCIYCIGTELHLQFALRCVVLCCVVLCCVVLCCVAEWSGALRSVALRDVLRHVNFTSTKVSSCVGDSNIRISNDNTAEC